jgi:CBS domain-containing protein
MSLTAAPELTCMPHASDVMQTTLINVFESMPANEVAHLLTDRRISGAPVVNEAGKVVGVISLFDLAARHPKHLDRAPASPGPSPLTGKPHYYGEVWFDYDGAAEYFGAFYADDDGFHGTAADLMSPTIIQVASTASLSEIVKVMLDEHVHRVLVTEGERVVGIVSTLDIMRFVPGLLELVRTLLPAE